MEYVAPLMMRRTFRDTLALTALDPFFWVAFVVGPIVWALVVVLGRASFAPGASGATLAHLALVILAYPIAEEILFRGVMQPAIDARITVRALPGISAANWLTSMAFGAVHLIAHSPAHAFATIFPSLVFGFLRDRHRSIVPGLLLHIWYNAGWFLLLGPRR